MIKEYFVLFICLLLIVSLTACGILGNDSVLSSSENQDDTTVPMDQTNTSADISLPNAYSKVIEYFKSVLEYRLSEDYETYALEGKFDSPVLQFDYEWWCMIVESTLGTETPDMSMFGYVLKDINSDGISELFMVRNDPESYSFILALYTLHDGEAVLLGAYWPKHDCYLLESGELLVESSGGASLLYHEIQTLEKNGTELTTVNKFGFDLYDTEKPYFETVDGEISLSSEERVDKLLDFYKNEISKDFWEDVNPLIGE